MRNFHAFLVLLHSTLSLVLNTCCTISINKMQNLNQSQLCHLRLIACFYFRVLLSKW